MSEPDRTKLPIRRPQFHGVHLRWTLARAHARSGHLAAVEGV